MNILIVNEKKTSETSLDKYITMLGYKFKNTTIGEEAFTLLDREKVDVMIMDLSISTIGGWQEGMDFLRIILRLYPQKKIIVLVQNWYVKNTLSTMHSEVYRVFQKPLDFSMFEETLIRLEQEIKH